MANTLILKSFEYFDLIYHILSSRISYIVGTDNIREFLLVW